MNLADVSTTIIALKRGGYEMNPIARYIIGKIGLNGLFAFKYIAMGLSLLLAFITQNEASEIIIWLWNIVLSAVVVNNSYVNLKLAKRKTSTDEKY